MTVSARTNHVLISTDAVGGVWTYSLALARGLTAAGLRCTLAVLGPAPDAGQLVDAGGLRVVTTGLALDWTVDEHPALDAIADGLAACARAHGATSVHLHAPCLAARRWHVPVVAVAHSCMATWWDALRGGPMPPEIAWHAQASLEGLVRADRVVAPTAAFAVQLRRCYGLSRTIDVVHNGVADTPAGATPRQDHVLAAGRVWDEAKNMAVLDAAAGMMRTKVHVAGPLAAPGGGSATATHLRLLGRLAPDSLRTAMAQAAAFAAPARYEPFGLSVLEAAQAGTPLVLADIAGFRELWDGAALFLPADNAPAWAGALDALVADPARRAALGGAAQARAARYTQAAMVAATAALHAALPALQSA